MPGPLYNRDDSKTRGKTAKDKASGKWQRHIHNKNESARLMSIGSNRVCCGSQNRHKNGKLRKVRLAMLKGKR